MKLAERKPMHYRLSDFIITIMITALLLTGAVPSFGWNDVEGSTAGSSASEWSTAGLSASGWSTAGWSMVAEPVFADEADGDEASDENASNVLPAINIDYSDAPRIRGKNAIAIDLETGTPIYEKNPDKVIEPASLTKILTALVVLETLDLDQVITVPDSVEINGSVIWLEPGEKMTVEDLLYGMMLESGNDAAQVLGLAAGDGDLDKFSDMMNARAKECGATHTNYKNPNGLNEDRSRLNYTTALDLALITREAMKIPAFREVVSSAKHTIPATNKSEKRKLVNSNVCLWLKSETTTIKGKEVPFKYKGCNGVKTGFTSDAGYCFVGSAKRKGTDFVVVSLGCEDSADRFRDGIILWNYAFSKYETYPVLKAEDPAGVQRVWGGAKRKVEVGTQSDLGVTIRKGTAEEQNFTTEFRLNDSKADAPIAKGQKMGQALVFNSKGRLVGKEDLYALASVAEGGPLSKIGIADEDLPLAGCIAGAALLLILILIIAGVSRRRRSRRRKQESIRGELANMRTSGTGMTASELTDLTGVEEIMPIPKGPARISNEELNAWTSTSVGREAAGGNSGAGRYGAAGSDSDLVPGGTRSYERFAAPDMPKMNITPRQSFSSGAPNGAGGRTPYSGAPNGAGGRTPYSSAGRTSAPGSGMSRRSGSTPAGNGIRQRKGSISDEELFAMLESTEVYDRNQPRHHGKLTDTERQEVLSGKATSSDGDGNTESSKPSRFRKRK